MSEKHYPYYGGNFDRIIFDKDGSVWVPEVKLRDVESENASLRGAVQGLGELCDRYKAENAKLRDAVDYLYGFAQTCGVDADDMRERGVEVDG